MIEDDWMYWAPSGAITSGGPSTWYVLDGAQRRTIAVTMDEEQETDDDAIEHLKKYIDTLEPNVLGIHVSPDGQLVSVSADSEDDQTTCVYHPPLQAIRRPDHVMTVLRTNLLELDRLAPKVDLVSYQPCANVTMRKEFVFEYYFDFQFLHRSWHEMNLWIRFLPHPNIVPLDRLVLDELHGHVVGFATPHMPAGTLDKNTLRAFKLEWLRQRTQVVDDLNVKHGIAHQDNTMRNLLVDPKTDALMLFDFNF